LNRRPKYLRRLSFLPKVIVSYNYKHTHTDKRPIALYWTTTGQLILPISGTENEYTSQSAVTLCGWRVKTGVVHFNCGKTCGCEWQVKKLYCVIPR